MAPPPGKVTVSTAGVGAGIGLGEMAFGVESKRNEAKRLAKSIYSVSINNDMADKIVGIAQSKYGNTVSIAIRDPDVRKMLELYAAGTGQKMPLSSTTPRAGSLVETGGGLTQQSTYQFGVGYTYKSGMNLPVSGPTPSGSWSGGTTNPGNGGDTYLSLQMGNSDAQSYMQGQYVRLSSPGLVVG